MARKKAGLPEVSVKAPEHQELVQLAASALDLQTQISSLSTQLAEKKAAMVEKAKAIRQAALREKGEQLGLVRITGENQSPTQVQFKIVDGALDLEEAETLERLFGPSLNLFFERDIAIANIHNPGGLVQELQSRDQDPWTILQVSVRKNLDRAIAHSPHATTVEAFLPLEGFLATYNEVSKSLSPEAKDYVSQYLAAVLQGAVDLGKK